MKGVLSSQEGRQGKYDGASTSSLDYTDLDKMDQDTMLMVDPKRKRLSNVDKGSGSGAVDKPRMEKGHVPILRCDVPSSVETEHAFDKVNKGSKNLPLVGSGIQAHQLL